MFDGQEFLDVARHLQDTDSRDGFQRSALSRAYYSAFLLARSVCRERGWIAVSKSGADHRNVTMALAQVNEPLASKLRILRTLRNEADYTIQALDVDVLSNQVQYAIDLAASIRRELGQLT